MLAASWILGVVALVILVVVLLTRYALRKAREASQASEPENFTPPVPMQWERPIRHRYDPEEFESPLHCVTCGHPILPKAEFWEIPVLNDERPEALLAVCLQCDSRSPYDQLEDENA